MSWSGPIVAVFADLASFFSGRRDHAGAALSCGAPFTVSPLHRLQSLPEGASPVCDVASLTVTLGADRESRTLSCNRPLRFDPPPQAAPERIRGDLTRYDLVFEMVGEYPDPDTGELPEKPLELSGNASYAGSCPKALHALIVLDALDFAKPSESRMWQSYAFPKIEIHAADPTLSESSSWLDRYWRFTANAKVLAVTATSCGVRRPQAANHSLNCLVRVVPKDAYTLKITAPAVRRYQGSREKSRDIFGTQKEARSRTTEAFGKTTSGTSVEIERNERWGTSKEANTRWSPAEDGSILKVVETSASEERGGFRDSKTTEASQHSGTVVEKTKAKGFTRIDDFHYSDDEPEEGLRTTVSHELRPGIVLSRNGRELDVTRLINGLFKLSQLLKEAFEAIQQIVPKIGYSASFEIALLEGSLQIDWGNRSGKPGDDRFTFVEEFYRGTLALSVIRWEASAMVGIETKLENWIGTRPLFELTAKVEIAFTGDARLEASFESGREFKPTKYEGESSLTGLARFRAQAGGRQIGGELGVKGAFVVAGEFKVSFSQAPTVSAEVKRRKTIAWITIDPARPTRVANRAEIEIWQERTLWQGAVPENEAA